MTIPACLRKKALYLHDEGMEDQLVISGFVHNKDGSITVSAAITVTHPDGRKWQARRDVKLTIEARKAVVENKN